jgi:tetratricopeptide (TPR) repeat protein
MDKNTIKTALQYFQSGDIYRSEKICKSILQKEPDNSEILHLVGLIAGQGGRFDESIDYITKAVRTNPYVYSYYNNLGLAYKFVKRLDEAIENFSKAIELFPGFAGAYNNLAIALAERGQEDEALENFKKALTLKPDYTEAYFNLGRIYAGREKEDEAIENFSKALVFKPDYADAYFNIGLLYIKKGLTDEGIENYKKALIYKPDYAEIYNNLGTALWSKRLIDEAVDNFRKALSLKTDFAEAYNNLGLALSEKGFLHEAVENYNRALELRPDFAEAYNNLGYALAESGNLDEAITNCLKALQLKPDFAGAYNNLANAFKDNGLIHKAIENYNMALMLKPDDPEIHKNLGMTYLLIKDFDKGWEEYEWRLKTIPGQAPPLVKPKWDGTVLKDKAILVYSEQGCGDNIQFVRYLSKLRDEYSAAKILFIPYNGLEQLFRESNLGAEILDASTPVEDLVFDTNIHLLSLPGIFKTDFENIPFRQKRYLKANEEKVRKYKEKYFNNTPLSPLDRGELCPPLEKGDVGGFCNDKLKIGIFWQGSPGFKPDRNRSMPLKNFYPICRLPHVKVYSLQKGEGITQLDNLPEDIEIVNLGETFNDFSDTAAAIENLDIVITIDTGVAHLSGALGKKTWILLPSYTEWRWPPDMDYSPWYEDVTLFRHREPGKKDWEEMMQRVSGHLFHLLGLRAYEEGLYDNAITYISRAIQINPREFLYFYNIGVSFAAKNSIDEALDSFRKALDLNPFYAEAYNNLGLALANKGLISEAIDNYNKALELNPDSAEAYNNLGLALANKGLISEAIDNYNKALELNPDSAEAYNNLGNAFADLEMLDEAVNNFKKAIMLKPDFIAAYYNLGIVFSDQGMLQEAIQNYEKALSLNNDFAEAHLNVAYVYLLSKNFEKGWEEYEWRHQVLKTRLPLTSRPKWDGSSLDNKTIYIYPEQGYGDTIQFARYLPLLRSAGVKKVLFEPHKGMEQLFRENDLNAEIVDPSINENSLDFDVHFPLLSLPLIFKTNLDNIPFKQQRYFNANPEKVAWYREKFFAPIPYTLSPAPFRIGICWQGNPLMERDRKRSVPLRCLYPLAKIPGVKLYSFQKGPGIELLDNLPEDIEIVNLGRTFNDFSDTAAALENVDILITIDTAVAHLSGALGKKTWILLPFYAEWRWFSDSDPSPWYEDVRLFRHMNKKDWDDMMERVIERLKEEKNQ